MTRPACLSDEQVASELQQLEPIFHTPRSRPKRGQLDELLATEFFEVGASGRLYTRNEVVEALKERVESGEYEELTAEAVRCTRLERDCFLITYRLVQRDRVTRRSSIWRRRPGGWELVYHQGTIV